MSTKNILEACSATGCEGWVCTLNNPQQLAISLAALIGLAILVLIAVRLRTAAFNEIGMGIPALLAIGVALVSLPIINKISLSIAPNQSISLDMNQSADINKICTSENIALELNKPIISKLADIEAIISKQSTSPNKELDLYERKEVDIRIYYRTNRREDAEKLRKSLIMQYSFVDSKATDLTEAGTPLLPGEGKIRYEIIGQGDWKDLSNQLQTKIKDTIKNQRPFQVDPITRDIPGNIQILLY